MASSVAAKFMQINSLTGVWSLGAPRIKNNNNKNTGKNNKQTKNFRSLDTKDAQ